MWRWCVNCKASHPSGRDPKLSAAKGVAATFPGVVAQDIWAIEKQQEMFSFPDENYLGEVHLKSDTALLRAREIIRELVAEEGGTAVRAA